MWWIGLLACTRGPELEPFPEDFHFGAATAGFQVEAGCPTLDAARCEDRQSDWYQWVSDPELQGESGLFLSGDPMALAPGHYELYEADFARARELGLDTFRFSFEWSRLFPDGAAEQAGSVDELYDHVDADQLAWYHAYLDAMKAQGLEPMATINHYTLPLWVHDGKACHADVSACEASGWVDGERIVPLIALFSGFLAREFGGDIRWWLTLNEPLAVILSGYTLQTEDRTNPPGVGDLGLAIEVAWNMARAHARMSDAVHAEDADAEVGVVCNLGVAEPLEPDDPEDVEGAEHLSYVYNQLVLQAFLEGELDEDLDGSVDRRDDSIPGRTDWLGLNYYFAFRVSGFASPLPGYGDYAYMDFYPTELDASPERIEEAIALTAAFGLPIWITENGVADPDERAGEDFLVPALQAVQRATAQGDAQLHGYLYWSLVDNYEWNHGMGMRFGLYEVDTTTKARTLRPLGARYGELVAAHGVPAEEL